MNANEFASKVVAAALAMSKDKPCPNDGCDDGWMMKSDGEPCPVCDPFNSGPGGFGIVPRDFSVLDGPDLTQARVGLARDVASIMGWVYAGVIYEPPDVSCRCIIWGGRRALADEIADTPDAAAFEAALKALGGAE